MGSATPRPTTVVRSRVRVRRGTDPSNTTSRPTVTRACGSRPSGQGPADNESPKGSSTPRGTTRSRVESPFVQLPLPGNSRSQNPPSRSIHLANGLIAVTCQTAWSSAEPLAFGTGKCT